MLVMVVFFIAFRWIHLSTPLIRLFLLVLILLLMPTLNFLPVWFALSLLRFQIGRASCRERVEITGDFEQFHVRKRNYVFPAVMCPRLRKLSGSFPCDFSP